MIKGVNRCIIEITETGNTYYERALLFLKPEYASVQREVLEREAKRLLRKSDAPSIVKKGRSFMYWFLRLGGAATVGAVISAIIFA